MLNLNEKIIKEKNKDVILFLKFFHKKFNLYKLNSLYFYYLYFLYYISSYNDWKVYNNINFYYTIYLFKINYIFYLFCYNKNIILYQNNNIKRYLIDIIKFDLNLLKFKSNYFCLDYDLNLLSSINYKLILNLWYFMLYGKYIVYIVTYLYNLYLNTKCYLSKYPLINVILRFLLRSRLEKLIYTKKYKYSKLKFIDKYNIYDIKFKLNIYQNNIFNFKNNVYKLNIFKIFNLLSNKKLYMYLNFIWYKYIKINFLYLIYHLNIYNDYDNSLACEYNKFNILGVFSFYWQLNRYGFNVNYYFYYFSLLYFKYFNINDYNCNFYNNLNFINNKNINLFWYKIHKFIVLNHIRRSFFKYIRLNRFIIRNKLRRRLIIRKWLLYSNIYNMKFYPLKDILYNKKNIEYFIISLKKKIDYLYSLDLFNFIYKYYGKYNLNFVNVIYKINVSNKILNNFYFYQNYLISFIKYKLKKFYYINILNLNCCLKVLCKNVVSKFHNFIIYKNNKDLLYYNNKVNLYYFYKLKGLNKFMELYFLKIRIYLWYFEKSLMFNMFVKYMYHMYLFFFSVFSCYIKLNINIFNFIKLSKKNFIIKIRLKNKKKYTLIK